MGEKKKCRVLTQIFKERQRQDDSDGHEHHQVVPVQVPLTAERGYDEVRDYTFHTQDTFIFESAHTHPELSSKAKKARITSGSSYFTMKR